MERELIVQDRHIFGVGWRSRAIKSLSDRIDRYWNATGALSDHNRIASTPRSPHYEEIYGAPSERVERCRAPPSGMGVYVVKLCTFGFF